MAVGGTYTLLIDLAEPATVTFGAVGARDLPAGRFAYTGSALGPGGFARVDRHDRVAAGEHGVSHWHVDHLLGHPAATLRDDVRSPGVDAECTVARTLLGQADPVPGVGATDCGCVSHLVTSPDPDAVSTAVRRSHRRVRDESP